jgi:hypothetical protein
VLPGCHFGQPERLRNLAVFVAFQVMQQHDLPLRFSQLAEGRFQLAAEFSALNIAVGVSGAGHTHEF